VRFACPRQSRGHGNTLVEFKSLHSPGQYAIFPAENPKMRIFTGQKNVNFLPEAGKDISIASVMNESIVVYGEFT